MNYLREKKKTKENRWNKQTVSAKIHTLFIYSFRATKEEKEMREGGREGCNFVLET